VAQAPELLELAAKCAAKLAHQHGVKVSLLNLFLLGWLAWGTCWGFTSSSSAYPYLFASKLDVSTRCTAFELQGVLFSWQVFVEPDLHRHLASLVKSSEASDAITLPPMDALEEWHSGPSLATPIPSDAAADKADAPTAPSVDLVVTLGGDGLLIHANSLFPRAAPPILAVSGGSLGFLAPFDKSEMATALESGLSVGDSRSQQQKREMQPLQQPAFSTSEGVPLTAGLRMSLRMRLSCVFLPPMPTPPPSEEVKPPADTSAGAGAASASAASLSASSEHLTASEAADLAWEAAWVKKLEDETGHGLAEATEEWTVLNEVFMISLENLVHISLYF